LYKDWKDWLHPTEKGEWAVPTGDWEVIRNENRELTISSDTYQEEFERAVNNNKDLENNLSQITHESKVKTEEIKKIKKHYEDKLKDVTASNNKLSESYHNYRDNIAKKDEQINQLKDQILRVQTELEKSHGNASGGGLVKEIKNENDALRNDIKILRKQLMKIQEEYETKVKKVEREAEKAQKAAASIDEKEVENLRVQYDNLQIKFIDVEKAAEEGYQEIQNLKKDLKDAKNTISERNNSLSEKENLILSLKKQLEELNVDYETLKSSNFSKSSESEVQLKNLSEMNSKLELKISELEKVKSMKDKKLKESNQAYEELDTKMKGKMEFLHNDISKIKKESREQIEQLMKEVEVSKKIGSKLTDAKDQISELERVNKGLNIEKESLEEKVKNFIAKNKDILSILQKITKCYEPMNSNLSWLSCLEVLERPLMLIWGHSICMNCFNSHSDPKSKDSIVFCEECKIETKNKELMESKVIETLASKFKQSQKLITEGIGLMK